MPFTFASEVSRKKRKPFPARHPVLFPIAIFIIILIAYQFSESSQETPTIGVVPISGVILESESTIKQLRIMETMPLVKGIILHINSPGGAVAPSQEIFSEVLRIKKKKKVYVSINSTAASGGYYVAIGADKLYANPGSMVGSIGAIIQTFNFEGLLDKLGVRSEVVKSGKNKDIGSVFRQMNPEERKLLEGVINDTHDQFVTAIIENRPIEPKLVREISDGRVFTGRQAEKIALIDGLASFRETADFLKKDLDIDEEIELYYIPPQEKLFQSLIDIDSKALLKKISSYGGLFFLSPQF